MRTVSFSAEPVRKILNENFVCSVINTTGDPTAGSSMGHAPDDSPGMCTRGIGKQNVQCLFLTSQGQLFHTASGYRSPEDLVEELQFAFETFRLMKRRPSNATAIVRDMHVERLKRQGFHASDISQPPSPFGSMEQLFASMRGGRQGSGHRGRPLDLSSVFAAKTRASDLADGRFAVHHTLMPIGEFLEDPRILVGHESSAFSSAGNGGRLGN